MTPPEGCRYELPSGDLCGTQRTETIDGVNGRRCAGHPPEYSTAHRAKVLAAGDVHAADAYLETWLWIEAGPEPVEAAA